MRRIASSCFHAALIFAFAMQSAAAQQSDVNAYIANAPIAGVPKTPYSQWNEDARKVAFKRVVGFCTFLCLDTHARNYPDKAAAERATAEAKTCLGACVVNHLPQDFPQLAAIKGQLRTDYDKAKQLGSPISWPLPAK